MKEIQENNFYCLGKIRDLFKKIRDTKGTVHAKMGTVKYKNGPKRRCARIHRTMQKMS